MRPAYETDQDRSREQDIADKLAQLWDCSFVKTPRFYPFDYTILRKDTAVAFCEVKCRAKQYPTLMLSLHKWTTGVQLSRDTGLPFIVVASVPDGIHWHEVVAKPYSIVVGGRSDRGDPEDKEPCVLLPFEEFKRAA